MKFGLVALMALPALVAGSSAFASEAPLATAQDALLHLAPTENFIRVAATANRADGRYAVGEPVTISVTPAEDAFVYLIDIDAQGVATLLYPNAHAPENMLKAGERRTFPAADEVWQIIADRPGTELVKVIATKVSRDLVGSQKADPAGPFKVFRAAGNELAHALRFEVSADAARWGEAALSFTVGGGESAKPLVLTEKDIRPSTGPLDQLAAPLGTPAFPPVSLY